MKRPAMLYAAVGVVAAGVLAAGYLALNPGKKNRTAPTGYTDTPMLPNQPWRVHDIARPHPPVVTPGAEPGQPPSDAVVLFDGTNLDQWTTHNGAAPGWKLENGYVEVVGGTGDLVSKEKFGDCQIHVEWAAPAEIDGTSQWRGNSGIIIMSRYEIQVLDSWQNPTYADGQAGAIYGQFPPLVNPARRPGEWQSFDIVFEAPHFESDRLVRPARATVFYNGVLVHHRQEFIGRMAHRVVGTYAPHGPEEPLALQDHDVPVRYRNIWVRRLQGYDGAPVLTSASPGDSPLRSGTGR